LCDTKLRDLALPPDGAWLAVACGDGCVRVLDTDLFNEHATIEAHGTAAMAGEPHGATAVAWHPHKPVLLSGGKDGHLRAWHATDRFRRVQDIAAHKGGIYRIAFDAQGARLATASRDKTAKLWDARSLDPLARLDLRAGGHTHSVNDVLWCGGAWLTCGDDRRVIAWTDLP
jgi:WD40 repeat protein